MHRLFSWNSEANDTAVPFSEYTSRCGCHIRQPCHVPQRTRHALAASGVTAVNLTTLLSPVYGFDFVSSLSSSYVDPVHACLRLRLRLCRHAHAVFPLEYLQSCAIQAVPIWSSTSYILYLTDCIVRLVSVYVQKHRSGSL